MNIFRKAWNELFRDDPREKEAQRRHHELMGAVGENRQAIQNLESTVRCVARGVSKPAKGMKHEES